MHKNPRVAESAELPPRESHCQGLIKQRSIVGLRGSRGGARAGHELALLGWIYFFDSQELLIFH